MAEEFAGKYTFVSQNNFEEYLKAAGKNQGIEYGSIK